MAEFPTRIRRVELRCSDPVLSAGFYAELVGLEISESEAERAALRAPGQAEPLLILDRAERPGSAPQRSTGLFHTAFRYASRDSLAAALRRIGAGVAGARLTGASDHGVSEALYLDDPDGLGIEIYWDRPRGDWPAPGQGERVGMFTAPLDLDGLLAADEGSDAPARSGEAIDIGHVHLKVADPETSVEFWTETMRMELMTMYGADAAFLAHDGYHHHVGANSWYSRGADPEPAEGPGLASVAILAEPGVGSAETPDGIPILAEDG